MRVTSTVKNLLVLSASIVAAAVGVGLYLRERRMDEETLSAALRGTADVALLLYLVVFVARPLHQLVKSPATASLLRSRRLVGISLAGAHTVHLALVVWLYGFVLQRPAPLLSITVGGGAYVLLYAMLATSFDGAARRIGSVAWRRLHKTGLYWLGVVFANSIFSRALAPGHPPKYALLAGLILTAVAIRVTAFVTSRRGRVAGRAEA